MSKVEKLTRILAPKNTDTMTNKSEKSSLKLGNSINLTLNKSANVMSLLLNLKLRTATYMATR
jgi:hypothetical protein